eukprot:TRINITY_DN294_c0_g1_i1.p1 TRINITY_DN294_c0_g1~~TRINITY_DN294_c0_g1_i1.p1  ORF type:complete len:155 (-),score=44.73 TRINITY_DN294_c0_g1_i1:126-590(-)
MAAATSTHSTRYLLCADGSEHSTKAKDRLLKIIRPSDILYLLKGHPKGSKGFTGEGEIDPMGSDKHDNLFNQNQEYLEKIAQEFKNKGISGENIHPLNEETTDVRENILASAKEYDVEVIVMGSRGLGMIKSLLLGSVSTYVLQHATCSVMVVR